MTLREYRKKRDFRQTAEPRGGRSTKSDGAYVVQKHDASHLHYDFRLELDGVLLSWAVPKGPSLDPRQRRLAVQVEDHPFDYRNFEGTIPAGQYGGGTVMVWDQGTWTPHGDARAALRKGHLSFTLNGERLRGDWSLLRLAEQRSKKPNWLLMKKNDAEADSTAKGDVLTKYASSVVSDRTMDQIAAGKEPRKKREAGVARGIKKARSKRSTGAAKSRSSDADDGPAALPHAKPAKLPRFIVPQLATSVAEAPQGDDWLHEMKFDGYRMFCRIDRGKVRFISRNDHDWTARLQPLVEIMQKLPVEQAALDGEVVVLDQQGISHFQLLQNAFRNGTPAPLTYFVFDLLYRDGYDFTRTPLESRKEALRSLLSAGKVSSHLQFSDHFFGDGAVFHRKACRQGLEGIISKRRTAPYVGGRGGSWLKVKCRQSQELVIGGYTSPQRSRVGFGSLLLGYYDAEKRFVYAGRVGTGFDDRGLVDLKRQMDRLKQAKSPFVPGTAIPHQGRTTWIRPELVAQIEFANWTDEGLMRQAAFAGLREDKAAKDVTRDKPRKPPRRRAK